MRLEGTKHLYLLLSACVVVHCLNFVRNRRTNLFWTCFFARLIHALFSLGQICSLRFLKFFLTLFLSTWAAFGETFHFTHDILVIFVIPCGFWTCHRPAARAPTPQFVRSLKVSEIKAFPCQSFIRSFIYSNMKGNCCRTHLALILTSFNSSSACLSPWQNSSQMFKS